MVLLEGPFPQAIVVWQSRDCGGNILRGTDFVSACLKTKIELVLGMRTEVW